MRKRRRKSSGSDISRIRNDLFPKFTDGKDVSEALEDIFKRHPEWRHNPPGGVGKTAYIRWKEFTGHSITYRNKHGIYGSCECGFKPPED